MAVLSNVVIQAYITLYKENKITISEVPERYRGAVDKAMAEAAEIL